MLAALLLLLPLTQSPPKKPWILHEESRRYQPPVLPLPSSGFGHRVVTLDDVDGDCVPDLAVSAPLAGPYNSEIGAVFIISGRDGRLIHRFCGQSLGSRLGVNLQSCPDGHGADAPKVLIESNGGSSWVLATGSGAVLRFLPRWRGTVALDFDRPGVPDWSWYSRDGPHGEFARLPGPGAVRPRRILWLGSPLCMLGDLDGDGLPEFAEGEACEFSDEGGFVIRSGWDGSAMRSVRGPPLPRTYDLGWNLARAGDVDGDGVDDVMAASGYDGPVFIVSSRTGELLRTLHFSDQSGYIEYFGDTMALAGDVDGDGTQDWAVGCSEFMADSDDWYSVELFSSRDGRSLMRFDAERKSVSVAEARDFDGDGIADLPVGVPELDEVTIVSGRALRARSNGGPEFGPKWPATLVLNARQYSTEPEWSPQATDGPPLDRCLPSSPGPR